ncbi:hypothetical protein [Streptomyces sp. NPDC056713]|uniref:hypothetical protein n=1 Tax=Streptomyces sp. NPDC056713 TaxID=3345921 RepID=UPI0036874AE8
MGTRDQDQDGVAEPARPPLSPARAREMTAGLRAAMDDVRRCVAVLATRVRDAHAARVWLPLSHRSWEAYCGAEFGISRAQAYRLLDVARSLAAIHHAVTAGTEMSRTRDTDPAAAAALDYGLSQRALLAVSARSGDVAQLITRRLATRVHSGLKALDEPTVRAVVRQAGFVHENGFWLAFRDAGTLSGGWLWRVVRVEGRCGQRLSVGVGSQSCADEPPQPSPQVPWGGRGPRISRDMMRRL